MNFKNIDLLPCPFCGAGLSVEAGHLDGCYLKLMDEFRASGESDVLAARELAVAWNKRTLPEHYKIISRAVPEGFAYVWQKSRDKDSEGSLEYSSALKEYRRIFELQKHLWDVEGDDKCAKL